MRRKYPLSSVRTSDFRVWPSTNQALQIEPGAIVSDACASYQTLDQLSSTLYPKLKDVTQNSDFFSYYRLNLYNRECPYWDDSLAACGNIACAVNTIENESDIPDVWRSSELSKLEGPHAAHPNRQKQEERGKEKPLQGDLGDEVEESCVVEYDDECDERDYCIPEDAGAPGKGDYVSLLENPERFTGYAGEHAHMVWDAIYKENCFTVQEQRSPQIGQMAGLSSNKPMSPLILPDESCLEKRVFHRVISGMHASISTHLCHEYLNQSTGIWGPNLDCYRERLHGHPDRISNLYFNFALVTRAVAKLAPYLPSYTFCSGDPVEDRATKTKITSLAETAAAAPSIFDESLMFKDPQNAAELKEDFRARFRNVSRIMDCVGCDKCRLWGKLQTNGYGTALKVLFEFDGEDAPATNSLPLKRTELVALVNTMARLGNSMKALNEFRSLMDTEDVASQLPVGYAKSGYVAASAPKTAKTAKPSLGNETADTTTRPDMGDEDDDLHRETDWDASVKELKMVYHVILWIIKEWLDTPRKLFVFLIHELSRLWSWWIGTYVEPRMEWHWQSIPFSRDEL